MFKQVLDRLTSRFGPDVIAKSVASLLPKVISALLTLVIFYFAWFVLSRIVKKVTERLDIDRTLRALFVTVLRYTLVTLAIVSALGELGINTASLIASMGIVGLTLGFAAKDTLSNLISGLFIFWDRPFVIGDLIEIDGRYGKVEQITLRSTRVVTVDGKMLAIPNTTIVNSTVASYTNFPHLRLDLPFTVGLEEDYDKIRDIFSSIIEGDERFLNDPPHTTVMSNVGDYNITVTFRVWIRDESRHIPIRFWLREQLYLRLREARVDMPYETSNIYSLTPAAPTEAPPHEHEPALS